MKTEQEIVAQIKAEIYAMPFDESPRVVADKLREMVQKFGNPAVTKAMDGISDN